MTANHRPAPRRRAFLLAAAALLGACATPAPLELPAADVVIFGEQHDQPDHQRQAAQAIARLAAEGRLAALVIEMAERGRSTANMAPDTDAAAVRTALGWRQWDWSVYEGLVMTAVRAGIPVLGGNLPRERLRETMADPSRDALVDAPVRERIAQAVREGHCGALPAAQEPGMVRVQVARDASMAETVAAARVPGRTVVLHTGGQHAARDRGVPLHLARLPDAPTVHVVLFGSPSLGLAADSYRAAARTPRPDPCQGLAERLQRRAASAPAP